MFKKFWGAGRTGSHSEAPQRASMSFYGDQPPPYENMQQGGSNGNVSSKSGPLFPQSLTAVPLKSGHLFTQTMTPHNTLSSSPFSTSAPSENSFSRVPTSYSTTSYSSISTTSTTTTVSTAATSQTAVTASSFAESEGGDRPLLYTLVRNGFRNSDIRIGDTADLAFAVEYPLSSFGSWDIRLHRPRGEGILFKVSKPLFGWDFEIECLPNPAYSFKFVKDGGPYNSRVIHEVIRKRTYRFVVEGQTYQWDGAGIGYDFICKNAATKETLASVRRQPTSFERFSKIEITAQGSHIIDFIIVTAFALDEWEQENAKQLVRKTGMASSSSSLSSLSAKLSTMAVAAKEKSIAAAAVAKEKSIAAAAIVQERSVVWKERAAEISADVGVRAKEAYEAARKSEAYEKGAAYFAPRKDGERRSTNSQDYPSIFGMPLEEVLERTRQDYLELNVPPIVYRCVEYINSAFLDEVGLYRVSGSSTEVNQLKSLFNIGGDVDLFELKSDPNAVCSVLKAFLRELPEPVLTNKLANEFQALYPSLEESPTTTPAVSPTHTTKPELPTSPIPSQLLSDIRSLTFKLPRSHCELLRFLLAHLDQVQQHASTNKMSISNLAVIFSPTLQVNSALFRAFVLNWDLLFPKSNSDSDVATLSQIRPRPPSSQSGQSGVLRTTSVPPPRPPLPKSFAGSAVRRSTGDALQMDSSPGSLKSPLNVPPRPIPSQKKTIAGARSIDSMIEFAAKDSSKTGSQEISRSVSPSVTRSNVSAIASQFQKGSPTFTPSEILSQEPISQPSSPAPTNAVKKIPPPPPPSKRRTNT
ncbi:hypothetical protein HDU97_003646 [Phlyctochytrium planicorne]|nr:hypothetical protein HDU97_003646 [Phlyctochytrium planicorne]